MDTPLSSDFTVAGHRPVRAVRMVRRTIGLISLVAMATVFVLLGLFTWLYASLLSLPGLIVSLVYIVVWVGLTWLVMIVRAMSLLTPRHALPFGRWASISVQHGAGGVTLCASILGVFWLFYAQHQPLGSIAQRLHWWGHALLVVSLGFIVVRFFITVYAQPDEQTGQMVLENSQKRTRILSELAELIRSPWLKDFEHGTTGNRLRAALGWLEDELKHALPSQGFVLAQASVKLYLDDQLRLVTFMRDLEKRKEHTETSLAEVERLVLEGIDKSAHIARTIVP